MALRGFFRAAGGALWLLPALAAATLRRHALEGAGVTQDSALGTASRHLERVNSAHALAVGVQSVMAEATNLGLNAMGGALIAALVALLSLVVLVTLASMSAREKAPAAMDVEGLHRAPRQGHYERRQRPGQAACLASSRDARVPLAPEGARFPAPASPPNSCPDRLPPVREDEPQGPSSESSSSTPTSGPLCPTLLVQKPGGLTLAMVGTCAPQQQSEVLEFRRTDSTKDTVARAVMAEESYDGGVTLESALRLPLAFLDTGAAVGRASRSGPQHPDSPVVEISRMTPAGKSIFSVMAWDPSGEGCFMWRARHSSRGTTQGEPPLLAVRIHGGDSSVSNIVDGGGRLLASTEARREPGSRPLRLLHIAANVDAGLIMVAVIAAAKLESCRPRPRTS